MWGWIKLTVGTLVLLAIVALLHYHIPRRDVVRVLANEIIRRDYQVTNAQGVEETRTRDVRQIYAETPDGETMEFDNTDAPLYLKFDSANLTAGAEQLVSGGGSSNGQPQDATWAVITYYGWRIEFLSWFPNAIDIRRASEGRDTQLFPWHWTVIGVILLGLLILWRIIVIRISSFTDPAVEDDFEEGATRGFFSRTFGRLFR